MGKKLALIILCIAMVMFSGCAKTQAPGDAGIQEPAEQPTQPAPPAPVTEPEQTPPSAPLPSESVRAPSTQPYVPPAQEPAGPVDQALPAPAGPVSYSDAKVASLVRKARDKVESYSFLYQTSKNWDVIRDKYFIFKSKMKIDLYDVNLYNKRNYFDVVYLDMGAKTSAAYCEDRRHQRCIDPDRRFDVVYEDFIIKTPKEWMLGMPADAHVVGSETMDKRLATVVEYANSDGTMTRLWIDTFSGLPMQVVTYHGEAENTLEKYGFRDLSVNSVLASEVEHQ